MALIIQKYGGTSVGSTKRIKHVAARIAQFKKQDHQVVVVVSAMSGQTDKLLSLAKEIQDPPNPRELDVVLSTGEQVTIGLLSLALTKLGIAAKSYTGWQIPLYTDPRVVPQARKLDKITFEEMLELASLGSKVLQIRSVEFAGKYRVPLRVLSSLKEENDGGTLISLEGESDMEMEVVTGIAFDRNQARIHIQGIPNRPGVAYHIMKYVASNNINVDMIVQNIAENGTTDFSFTIPRDDYAQIFELLKASVLELQAKKIGGNDKVAKVSLVGLGMRSHVRVAAKVFKILANENIDLIMISTSEIKVSILVDEKYVELATRALHEGFELDKEPCDRRYTDV
jgi:aspartokinase